MAQYSLNNFVRHAESIGPIRAAVLLGILQTAHRFRTKRQLWTYSGLGIEVHSSADHQVVKASSSERKSISRFAD
jgi:transposase